MRLHSILASLTLAAGFACSAAMAGIVDESGEMLCTQSVSLDGSSAAIAPKYAPSLKVDNLHMALDIVPDFEKSAIKGEVTYTFKPLGKALDEIRLDAVDLTIDAVTSSEKIAHQVTDKEIVVTFTQPVPPGKEVWVAVRFSARPTEGLYFRSPATGYPADDIHLWTQEEPTHARHWYPCFDSPNARFTSEVTCHVPEGFTVLSNGHQVSATKEAGSGLLAVKWSQDKPHANYLITLVAGKFVKLEDKYRDIPLTFYTTPSDAKDAALTWEITKPSMEFLEREIGVPYPWVKYGQVVVRDFTGGGMENTSMTTLTEFTLHRAETETLTSSENLISHEMAHQWFGDLVTCKDWSHTWLNEGFATYYARLFSGSRYGRDEMLYGMYQEAQRVFTESESAPKRPIVYRNYDNPHDQFDYRSYPKGAWVLHMLRNQLGEDIYRKCIKTYLERHRFQSVVTEDLLAVFEELSGRSFDQFFDQWVFHPGHPELRVDYHWDDKTKLAKVSVFQEQKLTDGTPLFRFPLTLRFKAKGKTTDREIEVKDAQEDFYVPLPAAPEIVRVDPDYAVLAKVTFKPPAAMLYAQLADSTDVIGRVLATEALSDNKETATVGKLKEVLNQDKFYGVRVKAAESLKKLHDDDAFAALTASVKQPDARARKAVIDSIAGFYRSETAGPLGAGLDEERNPAILAARIAALGPFHTPAVYETLIRFLNSDSYHNAVADAAVTAIRTQEDPAFITPLRETLTKRRVAFTTRGFTAALDALGFIARNEKEKAGVREFLLSFLNDKRERVQLGAITALASLDDPAAIPPLQTIAAASKWKLQQKEAEKSVAALRAGNKPADNLKDLRTDMLELQKANRDLKKDIEDLKKRLHVTEENPKDSAAKPKDAGAKTTGT